MVLPRSPDGGRPGYGAADSGLCYGTLMPIVYVPLPDVDATM
jgi:hypothetical protein